MYMKQIIIKPDGNNCKVESVKDLSPKLSEKILKNATSYFSYDRLDFTTEEIENGFKTFTYIEDGVKYRIVVTAKEEALTKNINQIVNTISDNTAWYACLDGSKLRNMDKKARKAMEPSDSEIYSKILENKIDEDDDETRMALTFAFTLIANIILASAGIYPVPFVIARYAIGIVAAYHAGDKFMENSISEAIPSFIQILALHGLPYIISSVSHKIATAIRNMIGDIKNDTFNLVDRVKGLFNKHKKNSISLKHELEEAKNSIEDARIDPTPYVYDTNSIGYEPVYIDLLAFANFLKDRIEELPFENRGEYFAELNNIIENQTLKDLSQSSQAYVTTKDRLINLYNRIESLYYMIGDVINVDPLAEVTAYRKTG